MVSSTSLWLHTYVCCRICFQRNVHTVCDVSHQHMLSVHPLHFCTGFTVKAKFEIERNETTVNLTITIKDKIIHSNITIDMIEIIIPGLGMCAYVYICVHMCTYMCVCMCVCVCMCTCACVCVYVCMHACMLVRTGVVYMCTYMTHGITISMQLISLPADQPMLLYLHTIQYIQYCCDVC